MAYTGPHDGTKGIRSSRSSSLKNAVTSSPLIKDGSTPIYIAAQQGPASVMEQLISACCSVDLQDVLGETPFYVAADNNGANNRVPCESATS